MDKPRRPRRATHSLSRLTPRGPNYSSRKRRGWRPFGLIPNQFELLIGLVLVLVLAVAQFMRSASFNLDRLLELVGLAAIALALGWASTSLASGSGRVLSGHACPVAEHQPGSITLGLGHRGRVRHQARSCLSNPAWRLA